MCRGDTLRTKLSLLLLLLTYNRRVRCRSAATVAGSRTNSHFVSVVVLDYCNAMQLPVGGFVLTSTVNKTTDKLNANVLVITTTHSLALINVVRV